MFRLFRRVAKSRASMCILLYEYSSITSSSRAERQGKSALRASYINHIPPYFGDELPAHHVIRGRGPRHRKGDCHRPRHRCQYDAGRNGRTDGAGGHIGPSGGRG